MGEDNERRLALTHGTRRVTGRGIDRLFDVSSVGGVRPFVRRSGPGWQSRSARSCVRVPGVGPSAERRVPQ
jgi:hypothetical protein